MNAGVHLRTLTLTCWFYIAVRGDTSALTPVGKSVLFASFNSVTCRVFLLHVANIIINGLSYVYLELLMAA
jgi:hypothetical protein